MKIKKNTYGFSYVSPTPNKKKLNHYYEKKYFKTNTSYKEMLSSSEENYLKSVSTIQVYALKKIIKNLKKKNLLDLGAGKGTFLMNVKKYFKSCVGVDFSISNLNKNNRSKVNFISESAESFIKRDLKKFDVITLNNVLEHVPNPIKFMKVLKRNIKKGAYILICVPNDFSELQKITNKKVKKKNYWVHPPEHLNYFNKTNFAYFSKKLGFTIIDAMADFPIELFLLSKDFDYTKDKELGKKIHLLRCEIFSYLSSNCTNEKLYNFSKIIFELDIGRDNFYLIKKNNL
jgi:2-polyprenyl-3-methyl-5-hydroxy-6-metoxy-1,4-benzoquinol methylase